VTKSKNKRRTVHAVICKSRAYAGMLTIKVMEKGNLVPPRRAIMKAGYMDGDKVVIVPDGEIVCKCAKPKLQAAFYSEGAKK